MQVIANRQLRGEYGIVVPDQLFECSDETAQELLKSGWSGTRSRPGSSTKPR